MLEYADLVVALERGNVREQRSGVVVGLSKGQKKAISISSYDLGGLLLKGETDFLGDSELERMGLFDDLRLQPILGVPNAILLRQRSDEIVIVYVAGVFDELVSFRHERRFGWIKLDDEDGLYENFWLQGQVVIAEAEANIELVQKQGGQALASLNKRRASTGLNAVPKTRVISLSSPRRVPEFFEPSNGSGSGTHARPVEHVRVLDGRWIYPKNRSAYWRNPKTLIVNEGVPRTAITRVRP